MIECVAARSSVRRWGHVRPLQVHRIGTRRDGPARLYIDSRKLVIAAGSKRVEAEGHDIGVIAYFDSLARVLVVEHKRVRASGKRAFVLQRIVCCSRCVGLLLEGGKDGLSVYEREPRCKALRGGIVDADGDGNVVGGDAVVNPASCEG